MLSKCKTRTMPLYLTLIWFLSIPLEFLVLMSVKSIVHMLPLANVIVLDLYCIAAKVLLGQQDRKYKAA